MRYALTAVAAVILLLAAGCASGTTGTGDTGAATEAPAAGTSGDTGTGGDTGASDAVTDTTGTGGDAGTGGDTGASESMTDTTGTMTDTAGAGGDTGASDAMTDTTGATGAMTDTTDAMTDTTGTMTDTAAAGGDTGASDAMTDTTGATGAMTDTTGAAAAAGGPTAHAEMMTADGTVVGMAHFTATEDGGVMVQVDVASVAGAAPGEHGIHVHMVGACDPPDFMSAGEHFNPTAMKHGLENPDGPHAGDLPNITLDDAGSGTYSAATATFTLGEGENSLLDADGSALIIHANPDDQVTDPSGNSGARLVCGVVTADAAAQ